MTYTDRLQDFVHVGSLDRPSKRKRSCIRELPQLHDITAQYPILSTLAENLSIGDLVNLGLASKTTWTHVGALDNPLRLRKGLAKCALKCDGMRIQTRPQSPHQGTPYVMPCPSSRLATTKTCEGCGVAVCEKCRFRPTHGAMITYTHKRRWFFPSSVPSQPDTVTTNIETMIDSMTRRGRLGRRTSNASPASLEHFLKELDRIGDKPCDCSVENRWLDKWLCVPCFNRDIYSAPTHEAYYARRRSSLTLLPCFQSPDIARQAGLVEHRADIMREIARCLKIEQCSLCHKRLPRRDAARKGHCLPPPEESQRRKQLHQAAKRLQCKRDLPVITMQNGLLMKPVKNRRGSWPRTRMTKHLLTEAKAEIRRRRQSDAAVFDD